MDRRVISVIVVAVLFLSSVSALWAVPQRLNGSSAVASQDLLPASTKAWLSIPDSKQLDEKFLETQLGQLAKDPQLKPFIESVKGQFRDWMREKNVRLGLNLEDVGDIRSGEICIAGILPPQAEDGNEGELARGSHGIVLLVDVSQNLEEAKALLENQLANNLRKRGAKQEEFPAVHGAEASKWRFPNKSRLKRDRFAFHTITNGWLLASDNENIFRMSVRRLVNIDNVKKGETLSANPSFQNVMRATKVDGIDPQVQWYVNPFGYFQLAQAIEREELEFKQTNSDDWVRILKRIGFDGFKGIGGFVAFATADHEILHRTFVYKPVVDNQGVKQKRVFGFLDFENKKNHDLAPPAFVSDSVSGYFAASWDMQRALKNIGHAIDTFTKNEGFFEDLLKNLRIKMQVDVPQVVAKFDNEIMVISDSELPVGPESERVAIAIRLNGDPYYVMENLKKSWPNQHREVELGRFTGIEIDDSIGAEDLGIDDDDPIWDDPGVGVEEPVEEEEPAFSLFAKRFCATSDDYLFVSNNQDYLEKLLTQAADKTLSDARDYNRVVDAISVLTDKSRISFRHFTRLDRTIRLNYEMMRAGKMATSNTMLARVINQLMMPKNVAGDAPRQQKIDGSLLPADFDNDIAPYFGPSGWVMETVEEGWLFTGCLLERQEFESQVVKNEDNKSTHK